LGCNLCLNGDRARKNPSTTKAPTGIRKKKKKRVLEQEKHLDVPGVGRRRKKKKTS